MDGQVLSGNAGKDFYERESVGPENDEMGSSCLECGSSGSQRGNRLPHAAHRPATP
jgi:hypothetical protein